MKEKAIKLMQKYFQEQSYIDHALAVTGFAEEIMTGERVSDVFSQQVIILAGIFHDVGIPVALKQHGSAVGPLQEQEGEPVARELLTRIGVRPDIRERVCYLVGHHHSPEYIDGLDFQILFEADALVNIPNRYLQGRLQTEVEITDLIEQTFRTGTGQALVQRWRQSL